MVTMPIPHMDWAMRLLEWLGLNQKRTSPHDHLVCLKNVPQFTDKKIKYAAFLAQWEVLTK